MKLVSEEEFIRRCEALPNAARKSFAQTKFVSMADNVKVQCLIHGEYTQNAQACVQGKEGCRLCSGRIKTLEEFITLSDQTWGAGRWNYSKAEFSGKRNKMIIICPEHGEFQHLPQSHTSGKNGCPGCNGRAGLTKAQFEEKVTSKTSTPLDYSKVPDVVRADTYVTLTCKRHEVEFSARAYSLYARGHVGCWRCYPSSPMNSFKFNDRRNKAGITKAYDYSRLNFSQGVFALQEIGCPEPEHGWFTQTLDGHLSSKEGCPDCQRSGKRVSKGQLEIETFVKEAIDQTVVTNFKFSAEDNREIDIYIPALRIGIEFNGVYYHSSLFKDSQYHFDKWRDAGARGITLYQVWEDDWNLRKQIVQRHLARVLQASKLPTVGARKTEVRIITATEARDFLDENHIQGFVASSVYLGLRQGEDLVGVGSFLKSTKEDSYYLTRFATSLSVPGGHSKVIHFFESNYEYSNLVTFADLTFGSGDLYARTGWVQEKILAPDYSYLWGNRRHHKFNFRKSRFYKDPALVYHEGMTESELAAENNLLRVYDAGKIKFVKPHPGIEKVV